MEQSLQEVIFSTIEKIRSETDGFPWLSLQQKSYLASSISDAVKKWAEIHDITDESTIVIEGVVGE